MKKYLIIVIFLIFSIFIFKIPKYVELNNLMIVEGLGVKCNNDNNTIYLREVIPIRGSNGIKYKYKIYEDTSFNIDSAYQSILNKTNKKIYLRDVRYIITNCRTSNKIIKYFKVRPKYIIHKNIDN